MAGGRDAEVRKVGPSSSASKQHRRQKGDSVYTVRRGDTLWGMAAALDIPLGELVAANGGSSAIAEGEQFYIPIHAQIRPRSVALAPPQATSISSSPSSSSVSGAATAARGGSRARLNLSDVVARRRAGGNGMGASGGETGKQRCFWDAFYVLRGEEQYRTDCPRIRKLLHALRCVETSNCPLPAPAGDNGTSIGPLQISHAYHNDAWGLGKDEAGSHDHWMTHCQGVEYSERTCLRYWMRWCPWALQFGDVEALARTHNGGPKYHRACKTARYWRKVKVSMEVAAYDFRHNPRLREWKHERKAEQDFTTFVPWECRSLLSYNLSNWWD